jgi:hypothetical protein
MLVGPQYPGSGTLLANGKVLFGAVYGQFDFPAVSAQLYDPVVGTFSLTGASTHAYAETATMNLLANGQVLETLYYGCDADNEAELYDPAVGTFRPTGNMTAFRDISTGVLLPDGTVLIAGGSGAGDALDGGAIRAELYDPAMGAFSLAGSLTEDRFLNTATLLHDGAVLIAGGTGWKPNFQCCLTLASAEIYHPVKLISAPVLFSLSGDGQRQGAILHADTNQVVSSNNPATVGEVLEIYGTGLIAESVIPPQVAIGGRAAEVLFFGNAPGFAGLNQINVRVPNSVAAGPAVPVRLNYLNRPSNEVTIAVQ